MHPSKSAHVTLIRGTASSSLTTSGVTVIGRMVERCVPIPVRLLDDDLRHSQQQLDHLGMALLRRHQERRQPILYGRGGSARSTSIPCIDPLIPCRSLDPMPCTETPSAACRTAWSVVAPSRTSFLPKMLGTCSTRVEVEMVKMLLNVEGIDRRHHRRSPMDDIHLSIMHVTLGIQRSPWCCTSYELQLRDCPSWNTPSSQAWHIEG